MKKPTHEEVAKRIAELPIDPLYRYDPDIPIPLGRGVLVKKLEQSTLTQTSGGVLIIQGNAENSTPPHLGIIQAVGPDVSDHLRVGLRCYYNFYCDSSFFVNGQHYAKMDEHDVFYIVPPKALVFDGVKSDKEVGREKRFERQVGGTQRIFQKEQNEKDEKLDKTKGKIRPIN